MNKDEIIKFFEIFSYPHCNGLEKIFSGNGKDEVFERLESLERDRMNKVQLNQLFILSGLPGFTYGFFKYYWLIKPDTHTYDVTKLEDYNEEYINRVEIISVQHLRWGFRRLYTDSLLYFGNISRGYSSLSLMKEHELYQFFDEKRFPIDTVIARGHSIKFLDIPKEDRYLISEMACKTYEATPNSEQDLKQFLIDNYYEAVRLGHKQITVKDLLAQDFETKKRYELNLPLFEFSSSDILEKLIERTEDIDIHYSEIATRFLSARKQAIQNTKFYLSLVNDLDVYVATSMRNKQDFIEMAENCEKIFKDMKIKPLNLRYFDPTISAADGHEDKGMIECLMVKCAKVLVYSAGIKESYGKDAEAAMALSTGKPVIFYCMDSTKADFYKKVHPLTKLIDFSSGVANGAMVTFQVQEVVELIRRIFYNLMEYKLEQPKPGYFRLVEISTNSPVRVQTNDDLLTKSFWNYFDRFL